MEASPIVVIPTYNERENVRRITGEILAALPASAVLFVDDNSPDGTGAEVEALSEEFPGKIHLLRRPGKSGLGTAYREGFRRALEGPYTHIFQMDADGQHDPRDLPRLLAPVVAGEADLAIGSRYVGGGSDEFTRWRRFVSRGGSLYARTVLGVRVRDLTGGFKCWRREVLASIDLDDARSQGYAFQIEMTYRALRKGFRAVEVPIHFGTRAAGASKMSGRILVEALLMMWRLRFRVRQAER
jgi:dolichol-phosphate mannosyltransferase